MKKIDEGSETYGVKYQYEDDKGITHYVNEEYIMSGYLTKGDHHKVEKDFINLPQFKHLRKLKVNSVSYH